MRETEGAESNKWMSLLKLKNYKTYRCKFFRDRTLEWAFGAVVYSMVKIDGSIKVAVSLPRLELQAAVLGSCLAKTILENHTVKNITEYY
ncbi:hypothetical protein JTB14_001965 [Gonioctena quinquepunctata]|nr:hypothetical protein JTB14_001965 [Gonioctena quinquepunctata]